MWKTKPFYSRFSAIIILIVGGWCGSCDTEKNIDPPDQDYFIKYYGGNGDQSGVDLIANDDGTVLLLGNWSGSKIYLVKCDAKGNAIWKKTLGTNNDVARDIERTNDGNFIILSDYQASAANTNIKLIRIDQEGQKIDSAMYGTPGNEIGRSVTRLKDGGFIVTGTTEYDTTVLPNPNNPKDLADIFHFRCNSSLVFNSSSTWNQQFGSGIFDEGVKVIQRSDNQFYVFAHSSENKGDPDGKLNLIYYPLNGSGENGPPTSLGDLSLQTKLSFAVQVPEDLGGGGYLLIGTRTNLGGSTSLQVSKLKSNLEFNSLSDKQLDKEISIGTTQLESVAATAAIKSAQGFILLANQIRGTGEKNIWISKIDQIGGVYWSSTFGSEEGNDTGAAVLELEDGKILVLGTMEISNNQTKMALLKLNSNGQLSK